MEKKKNPPLIISSYPRSGSTYLRFILANLFYPKIEHTFETVNKLIPSIDGDSKPTDVFFCKTHRVIPEETFIYIYRHVGDVLISEWYYKQKFHGDKRGFGKFLEACDYGMQWRENVDAYIDFENKIEFNEIGDATRISDVLDNIGFYFPAGYMKGIKSAINKSSFDKMQEVEKLGFGEYPTGNPDIKFVREGTSGQYLKLPYRLRTLILEKNKEQLEKLGY